MALNGQIFDLIRLDGGALLCTNDALLMGMVGERPCLEGKHHDLGPG